MLKTTNTWSCEPKTSDGQEIPLPPKLQSAKRLRETTMSRVTGSLRDGDQEMKKVKIETWPISCGPAIVEVSWKADDTESNRTLFDRLVVTPSRDLKREPTAESKTDIAMACALEREKIASPTTG